MKKIKLETHVWSKYDKYFKTFDFYTLINGDKGAEWLSDYIYIAPYTIEIELPKGLDLHKVALKALQDKRKLILAENEINVKNVDAEIQEFLAIEQK